MAHDFLTKAENLIADPWAMSAVPDFIYPETAGVRPNNLEERLNFQKGLGRLAARDAAVFELLMDVRNLLKPLNVLDDPSIVGRFHQLQDGRPCGSLLCLFFQQSASYSFLPLFC